MNVLNIRAQSVNSINNKEKLTVEGVTLLYTMHTTVCCDHSVPTHISHVSGRLSYVCCCNVRYLFSLIMLIRPLVTGMTLRNATLNSFIAITGSSYGPISIHSHKHNDSYSYTVQYIALYTVTWWLHGMDIDHQSPITPTQKCTCNNAELWFLYC